MVCPICRPGLWDKHPVKCKSCVGFRSVSFIDSSHCSINSQQTDRWPKLITHHISAWNLQLGKNVQVVFYSMRFHSTLHRRTSSSSSLLCQSRPNPQPVSVNVFHAPKRGNKWLNIMSSRLCNASSERRESSFYYDTKITSTSTWKRYLTRQTNVGWHYILSIKNPLDHEQQRR